MKQRALGASGLTVSELCLGCMYFGTYTDEETAFGLLDQYVAAGGNFLDTANNYAYWLEGGQGDESEALLGRWLKARKNRDKLVIATKVGAAPIHRGTDLEDAEGLGTQTIAKAIDESLARLGVDYIDLYYAHIDDRETPLEETLAAFDQLVRSGKVRALGCSNYNAWRIEQARNISRANSWASYSVLQQRYTYLRTKPGYDLGGQRAVSDEMLDYLSANKDVALLAYSPLLSGAYSRADVDLSDEYVGLDTSLRLTELVNVAMETNATPNQTVLAWLMQQAPGAFPIIAASNADQLEENIAAADLQLSDAQLAQMSDALG